MLISSMLTIHNRELSLDIDQAQKPTVCLRAALDSVLLVMYGLISALLGTAAVIEKDWTAI